MRLLFTCATHSPCLDPLRGSVYGGTGCCVLVVSTTCPLSHMFCLEKAKTNFVLFTKINASFDLRKKKISKKSPIISQLEKRNQNVVKSKQKSDFIQNLPYSAFHLSILAETEY